LIWWTALLPGPVERDAIVRFGLRNAGVKADDAGNGRSLSFVARKIGVCGYW
jgi:hypothetical protein